MTYVTGFASQTMRQCSLQNYAIKLALLRLQQVREQNTFVICSDSLSALKSLQNGLLHNPLLAEVLYVYNAIRGRQLTFL